MFSSSLNVLSFVSGRSTRANAPPRMAVSACVQKNVKYQIIIIYYRDLYPIEARHADCIHHREENLQLEKGRNVPWKKISHEKVCNFTI